ncbi:MAG: SEC-C metal-binding domain-containing protein, partial [Gaiellaceae bacterium]
EGHVMFGELSQGIQEEVVLTLFHLQVEPAEAQTLAEAQNAEPSAAALTYEHESFAGSDAIAAAGATAGVVGGGGSVATAPAPARQTQQQRIASDREKIGRNDPCWCGSGKKFKKCHGA